MTTYAVILDEPDEKAWQLLQEKWPKAQRHIHSDTVAFVSLEDTSTTSDVKEVVGMTEHANRTGIVLQVSHFNGWNDVSLWEWLRKNV